HALEGPVVAGFPDFVPAERGNTGIFVGELVVLHDNSLNVWTASCQPFLIRCHAEPLAFEAPRQGGVNRRAGGAARRGRVTSPAWVWRTRQCRIWTQTASRSYRAAPPSPMRRWCACAPAMAIAGSSAPRSSWHWVATA